MALKLFIHSRFKASHSLQGRETPHPHDWTVTLQIQGGQTEKGKLIDIVDTRDGLNRVLSRLNGTYLNGNEFLTCPSRATPTCETLAEFIYRSCELKSDPSGARLVSARVGIAEPGEEVLGEAEFSADP